MDTSPEAQKAQIECWNKVLGADCHLGSCKYRRGNRTYDLSAADPTQWPHIRDEGLFVI